MYSITMNALVYAYSISSYTENGLGEARYDNAHSYTVYLLLADSKV